MKKGRLSKKANRRSFAVKAARVNGKNLFSPRKLHKGGEIIR